jgi:amino acid transporter
VVVAVFSGVGFECATAFGEEAKKPLITIPRAVIASLLLTGAFFIFVTYVETHALANNNPTLDQLPAPLTTLSQNLSMGWMGIVIEFGAMISFFALALSCLNSGARIVFSMGRYGIFPISIGSSHKHNLTPHVAITLFALVQFLIPAGFMFAVYHGASNGLAIAVPLDEFNDAGTMGAMGFCGGYVLISLAAPFYLKKIGQLKPHHIALSVIALLLLIVPIVGLVWPVPLTPPMNVTPWAYGAYLLVGGIIVFFRRRTKAEFDSVRQYLEENAMASPVESSMLGLPPDATPAIA